MTRCQTRTRTYESDDADGDCMVAEGRKHFLLAEDDHMGEERERTESEPAERRDDAAEGSTTRRDTGNGKVARQLVSRASRRTFADESAGLPLDQAARNPADEPDDGRSRKFLLTWKRPVVRQPN